MHCQDECIDNNQYILILLLFVLSFGIFFGLLTEARRRSIARRSLLRAITVHGLHLFLDGFPCRTLGNRPINGLVLSDMIFAGEKKFDVYVKCVKNSVYERHLGLHQMTRLPIGV